MALKMIEAIRKKSLKERFLFVIGLLLFLIYFAFGVLVIFWKNFPIAIPTTYRIALGVIIIVYAFFRFFRILNTDKD